MKLAMIKTLGSLSISMQALSDLLLSESDNNSLTPTPHPLLVSYTASYIGVGLYMHVMMSSQLKPKCRPSNYPVSIDAV